MTDLSILAATCVAAGLSFGLERSADPVHEVLAWTPRSLAAGIHEDGTQEEAATSALVPVSIPAVWSAQQPAVVLVAAHSGAEVGPSDLHATLLGFGLAVVDWPQGIGAFDEARAALLRRWLGAEDIAAILLDPQQEPRLGGIWTRSGDERLDCALDAVLPARGHDALRP